MEIKRLQALATEIFKTINNINPSHMNNIFTPKTNAKIRTHDIIVRHHNTATYGDKSLTALGPKICNKLPTNVKSLTSITKFKEYIRTWFGPSCKCNVCRMVKQFIYLFTLNGFNVFIGFYSDLIRVFFTVLTFSFCYDIYVIFRG